jgi:type I restriction-modification system DNA methylase subunit
MKLFKDITIVEKLSRFEIPDFDEKIAIVKKWHDYFNTGTLKTDKEKEVAPDYTSEIFIDLLGYQGKTASNTTFTSEYTIGTKFPDGVIGLLNRQEQDDVITAVVELKGSMIPLDQPQKREKNYTPIEQGFGYKRLLRNCPFVIVSNFYELRLYNDNEIDYEVWNLDDLLDETDNYFNFRKFYYLLCAKNLITEIGVSRTESLLSEIRLEEQIITKKFYADYKSRRHLLLQNLYQKNETLRNDPDLLIEMGQKLIDRVIFMCFAEDRGLLPADILQTIKRDFEKSSMVESVWDSLKIAFNYVHRGNDSWGIPDGYNGGLFARDDRFDDLRLEGHVLSKIIDFGMYDFADQLSVTILGHIFEQSISDLEEIKEQIVESTNAGLGDITEPKTSKRKKDGIFYTPEYIVDYIVKNSLGVYLREHETKLIDAENLHDDLSEREYQKREQVVYTKYQQFLSNVKVLDPACGSGAFLVRVFDYLLEDNRRVGKILGGMFNTDEMYKSILQNNIYGVDLNAESVEITKLSLWLKSAQKGKKLSNLDNNIKCGNSLIDDPAVAGDKAFKWETEFPFCHSELDSESRGFDVIVGNPPYGAKSDKDSQNFLNKKYIQGASETAIAFIKLSDSFLKKNGHLSFIIPKSFLFSSNYKSIREYILGSIIEIIDCKKVWKEVKLEQIIFISQKEVKKDFYESLLLDGRLVRRVATIDKKTFQTFGFFLNGISDRELSVGQKIQQTGFFLNNISQNNRGGIFQKYISEIGDTDILGGAEIQRHGIIGIKGKINKEVIIHDEKSFVRNNSIFVQNIVSHIENPKPHIKITACLPEEKDVVIVDTINQITFNTEYSAKIFWLLLNSMFINWYVYRFILGKAIRTIHFDNAITSRIPIRKISKSDQQPFIEKADIMLVLNKQFHEQSSRFIGRMMDNYGLEKANKKLEKFWELDFGNFVSEMRKKSANVPLSTQDELQDYFEKNKSELLELDNRIKKTDRDIDAMVYELYRLNDDEIKIIENS